MTPLEVMLTTVRASWASAWGPDGKLDLDRAREAHTLAKDAAPYVHPRLAQIEGNPDKPLIPPDNTNIVDRARRMAFTFRAAVEGVVLNKTVEAG